MMKRLSCLAVVVLAALLLVSCSGNRTGLCPMKAKRVVQDDIAHHGMAEQGLVVPVGFFECNNADTRYQLRQLAACGIITYECQTLPRVTLRSEKQDVQARVKGRMRTVSETVRVADTQWCCFVTVQLAAEGEALLMPYSDEDLLDPDLHSWYDTTTYPEDAVEYVEFDEPEADCYVEDEDYDDLDYYDEWENEDEVYIDNEYLSAKQLENIEWVQLRAFGLRVAKVRNLRVYERQDDGLAYPMAEGEVIVELRDVTPVGRVVAGRYNGMRMSLPCAFVYYEGDGWQIESLDADIVFAMSSVAMQDLDPATERLHLTQDEILAQSAIDE